MEGETIRCYQNWERVSWPHSFLVEFSPALAMLAWKLQTSLYPTLQYLSVTEQWQSLLSKQASQLMSKIEQAQDRVHSTRSHNKWGMMSIVWWSGGRPRELVSKKRTWEGVRRARGWKKRHTLQIGQDLSPALKACSRHLSWKQCPQGVDDHSLPLPAPSKQIGHCKTARMTLPDLTPSQKLYSKDI